MTETSVSIASIHLGGAQTKKTAVVRASVQLRRILSGIPSQSQHQTFSNAFAKWKKNIPCSPLSTGTNAQKSPPLLWNAHIRDIGASPQKDADTRLLETLKDLGNIDVICIDAPLSLPPCANCFSESCAAVEMCNQANVQLMREEWQLIREKKDKKVRSPQCYTDRFFEFFCRHHLDHPALASSHDFEPILGAGRAPLTMRAHHIHKRIQALLPDALVLETSSAIAAMGCAMACGYRPRKMAFFRQDLESPDIRAAILRRLENKLYAVRGAGMHQMVYREFSEHHETFLAAMGALSAWALFNGEAYITEEFLNQNPQNPLRGWAIVPKEIGDRGWQQ